jgi:hypothetical protein
MRINGFLECRRNDRARAYEGCIIRHPGLVPERTAGMLTSFEVCGTQNAGMSLA